ncbi:MAG: hypothetical protein HYR55_20220 [Acidobacteria bacterium]|nr:hypothetical protein [Acidobacteriota bacterium]MBI3655295.1 hypothetical protein [Acidobacteriota bacterium]
MIEKDWQGARKDPRLYWRVIVEKKKMVREKYGRLRPHMNERVRRLWVANEAVSFGRGGVQAVAEAVAMSPQTIIQGLRELKQAPAEGIGGARCGRVGGRQRRPGGGRQSTAEKYPELVKAIEAIGDPATRGDPMAPLQWTSKSLKKIVAELEIQGGPVPTCRDDGAQAMARGVAL